jgi:hypothetical protein
MSSWGHDLSSMLCLVSLCLSFEGSQRRVATKTWSTKVVVGHGSDDRLHHVLLSKHRSSRPLQVVEQRRRRQMPWSTSFNGDA